MKLVKGRHGCSHCKTTQTGISITYRLLLISILSYWEGLVILDFSSNIFTALELVKAMNRWTQRGSRCAEREKKEGRRRKGRESRHEEKGDAEKESSK